MKRYILLFLVFTTISGYAQNSINNYKYVVVPEKFSFLKQQDQYKLNTLAKMFMEEKGFTAYFDNADLPAEIAGNRCNALNLDVLEKNGMFTTNLTVLLKDCKGNVVFKSKEGKSREKEYNASYNLALRDAFTSLNDVQYAYNGNIQQAAVTTPPAAVIPAVIAAPVKEVPLSAATPEVKQAEGTLYAQSTTTGYQLIDTTPKKVMTLFKTSQPDYFIADNGTSNGVAFKKNGEWFFEYYKDARLISEKLLIKF